MAATSRPLRAKTRQLRKLQLADSHGRHCGYCRRPFATLRDATLDHIVPNSLWRTGTLTALLLACRDCNQRKDDRFPLSLALALLRWADPIRPVIRPADLPLLARLAHANHTNNPTTAPDRSADPCGPRSTPHVPESTPTHPITPERTAA